MLESVKGSSGVRPAVRRLNWLLTTSMRPCAMSADERMMIEKLSLKITTKAK